MGADQTAVSAALKEHYAKSVAKILWDDPQLDPLMGIIEKRSGKYDAGGRSFIQPIQYGDGSSVSATFATAQAKAQGSTTGSANLYTRWSVTGVNVHAVAYWKREVIDQIQGESAMFDLAQAEMDGKMRGIRRDLTRFLPGDGYGAIGQITAAPTSTTITMSTDRINRLDVGDDLVAAATNGGGGLRSATTCNVTGTDPDTGVVTLGVDPTGLSWATGDYVFRAGDRQNTGSPVQQKIFGFDAWVPSSAPGATLFNAVNRQGVWQLGGIRSNATGKTIKKGLLDAANKLFNFGGTRVTHAFTSTDDFTSLCDQLDNVKHIAVDARMFKISFEGIELIGAQGGAIKVLPSAFIPRGDCWMGDFANGDNAYMIYSGDLVNIDDHDGNVFLRSATEPAYECRMYFFGNLVVAGPGKFSRVYNLGR
jgi:hypothetical protein